MTPLQSLISDEKQARKSTGAILRRCKTLDSPSSSKAPKRGVQRSKTMDSMPGPMRGVHRSKSSDMTSPSQGRTPRQRATSFTEGLTHSSHHRRAPRIPVRSGSGTSVRSTDSTVPSSRSSSRSEIAAEHLAMLGGSKSNLTRHLNKSDSDKSVRSERSALSDLTESSASDVSRTSRRSVLAKQSSVSELSRGSRRPRRHTTTSHSSKSSSSHSHKERAHSSRKNSVDRLHKSLSDVAACPDYNWSQGIYVKQNAQLVQNHPAPEAA